jgi:hypothetical protein
MFDASASIFELIEASISSSERAAVARSARGNRERLRSLGLKEGAGAAFSKVLLDNQLS